MQFTNKLNLPNYLVDWLKADDYDHNTDPYTISTTTLMKPVRVYWLTQRHADKLIIDVSDLIASKLGTAIHDSIEKVETPGVEKENRTVKEITVAGITYKVSGKYDLLIKEKNLNRLADIKTTSVWAYIYGGKDDEYCKQLSVYRWLLSDQYDIEPEAYINFIFTDWSSSKAKQDETYPQQRIISDYKIKLMSLEETEKYIKERVLQFHIHRDTFDAFLPLCTPAELWASDDTYAVYKDPKDKRATKVCESLDDAEEYMAFKNMSGYIQHRPGKAKRCKYCPAYAARVCNQAEDMYNRGMIDFF